MCLLDIYKHENFLQAFADERNETDSHKAADWWIFTRKSQLQVSK